MSRPPRCQQKDKADGVRAGREKLDFDGWRRGGVFVKGVKAVLLIGVTHLEE